MNRSCSAFHQSAYRALKPPPQQLFLNAKVICLFLPYTVRTLIGASFHRVMYHFSAICSSTATYFEIQGKKYIS